MFCILDPVECGQLGVGGGGRGEEGIIQKFPLATQINEGYIGYCLCSGWDSGIHSKQDYYCLITLRKVLG